MSVSTTVAGGIGSGTPNVTKHGRMQIFEDEMLDAIRGRLVGEPVLTGFSRFILQPRGLLAATDAGAAEELTSVSRVIANSPSLLAREAQILARYTDALANLIADETAVDRDDPRPWVAANALVGVHRAILAYAAASLPATTSFPTSPMMSAAMAKPRWPRSHVGLATTPPNPETPARTSTRAQTDSVSWPTRGYRWRSARETRAVIAV
jgi:MftR C-terminal domain